MKLVGAFAAIIMLSTIGAGMMMSHPPGLGTVQWSDGTGSTMESWSPDIRLTNSPLMSSRPAMVNDPDGNLQLAWADFRAGEPDIYYKKVDSQGKQLVADTRVSSSVSRSNYPALAIDPWGYVHIAWLDDRGGVWNVYYARLDGNGEILVSNLQLTDIQPGMGTADASVRLPAIERLDHLSRLADIEGRRPSIGVDDRGNAHIAWSDFRDGESDIRYTVVGAGGSIITDQARVSKTSADSYNAVVSVQGEETVLLWAEQSGKTAQIYFSRLDAAGNITLEPKLVLSGSTGTLDLDAVSDGVGLVRLAWASSNGQNYDIHYARVDQNGELVGPPVQVTSSKLDSSHPSIAVEYNGAVQLAWTAEPERLQRSDLSGIFYARLTAGGDAITAATPVSPAPSGSQGPDLVLSEEGLPTVVWSAGRNGEPNTELYLKTQVQLTVGPSGQVAVPVATPGADYVPVAVAVGGLGAVLALAFTEAGRLKLTVLAIPLYSRLRKEGLLNHSVREMIFGYVNEHPGANFSTIMRELNLKNGVLAYHLTTLEREDMIKSMRDGTYRRYYPRSSRSVPFEIQKAILEKIQQSPGLAEAELAGRMGVSRQVLEYHMNSLIDSGHVRLERHGKRNLAFVTHAAA